MPGTSCAPDKAVRVTANPTGKGGYILTCENSKWVATINAALPTEDNQVATKSYVDTTLANSIATIDTHTYSNLLRYTDTGKLLPVLVSPISPSRWSQVAAVLCADISNGQYVQGKILPSQRRYIHEGVTSDANGTYPCSDSCIGEPSGKSYAWIDLHDILSGDGFYLNVGPDHFQRAKNAGEVATKICGTWEQGSNPPFVLNNECMRGMTSSRPSISGKPLPVRWQAYVINSIVCWSN